VKDDSSHNILEVEDINLSRIISRILKRTTSGNIIITIPKIGAVKVGFLGRF